MRANKKYWAGTRHIILCEKTNSVCSFFTFPGNPSASRPNSFDDPFCHSSLDSFYFGCIRYLYLSIYPVYTSITALTRYQGKASSSIFVVMLCVAIGIVRAIWFNYSCVTICTLLGATLGGLPGLLFSCVSIVTSLGATLVGLPGFLCCGVSTGTSLGATFGGLPGFLSCVFTLGVGAWCHCCLVGYRFGICEHYWYDSISTLHRLPLLLLVDCC